MLLNAGSIFVSVLVLTQCSIKVTWKEYLQVYKHWFVNMSRTLCFWEPRPLNDSLADLSSASLLFHLLLWCSLSTTGSALLIGLAAPHQLSSAALLIIPMDYVIVQIDQLEDESNTECICFRKISQCNILSAVNPALLFLITTTEFFCTRPSKQTFLRYLNTIFYILYYS